MAKNILKKLRIQYFILRGIVARHKQRTLAIIGICLIFLLAIIQVERNQLGNVTSSDFVEGVVGQYQAQTLPSNIENLISLGLTKLTPNGNVVPSAAERWDVQEDGKLYTFYLRKNLTWQDGSAFTATDLNYLFDGVDTKVISPYVIQFRLKNPYSPFPSILSKPLLKGNNLLGLGEYKVTGVENSQNYLTAIHLQKVGQQNDAKNSSITFRFYPTSQDLITAYKLGELKAIYGFFDPTLLKGWKNAHYYKVTSYTSFIALYFNVKDSLLTDKTMRQALTFAIPKDNLPGEMAFSPIAPTSWAYNPDIKQYIFDSNHAKELVKKQAGSNQDLGTITLTTTPPYAKLASVIAQSWKQLGFTVSIDVQAKIPANFQTALIRQEIPSDPDQYALWHSSQTGSTNISHYASERIDKLLEDGREMQNQDDRKAKYQDFQRFLVEDDPAAFLYYPFESLFINKRYDTPANRAINGIM